jgi:lipid-A-disaccharide synthase-like uncharacterized protein
MCFTFAFLPRVFWIMVMLTATAVMVYFITTNLITYYGYPKTVNVEVIYEEQLVFPAVTFCPQNFFR